MAVPAFLILCGLSIGFLVYVLVQFGREGRRSHGNAERNLVFSRCSNPKLIVVTRPVSLSAQGGISVIPAQPQTHVPPGSPAKIKHNGPGAARVQEMPLTGPGEARRESTSASKLRNSLKVS